MSARTLISANDLASIVGRDDVLVVDCRHQLGDADAGRRVWQQAHLPGAVHADLDHDLADLNRQSLGRHPLPSATSFTQWLGDIGWTPAHHVVAYDDAGGALAAARLWWMLRLIGHENACVLDGGISAWVAAGGALDDRLPAISIRETSETAWSAEQLVDYPSLERGLADGSLLLVDARAEPRYRGELEPIDKVAGHVPGARNRPFSANLGGDGLFKQASELREEWLAVIDGRDADAVVHMCGSGVTACHNLLAMEHAGLTGSRLFAPSWSGWIDDPQRPVAVGAWRTLRG